MFQALEYVGYDVKFELGEGGHDMGQGAAILPDALRWLWRDYRAPIELDPLAAYNGPGRTPEVKFCPSSRTIGRGKSSKVRTGPSRA